MPDPIDHVAVFRRIIASQNLIRYEPSDDEQNLPEAVIWRNCRTRAEQLLAEHRKLPGGKMMPHVHFDYIDDPSINAKVAVDPSTSCGYIGMYTGTTSLLYDVFYRMLSHPNILPQIGNAAEERIRQPFHSEGFSQNYNDLLASRGAGGGRLADVMPNDPHRRYYAEKLAIYAFDFLVLHELGHIRHGHCQVARDHGINFISELLLSARSDALSTEQKMILQAMEMDADAYAAFRSFLLHARLQNKSQIHRVITRILLNAKPIGRIHAIELLEFDWAFWIKTVLGLLGLRFDPRKLGEDTPPPTSNRGLAPSGGVDTVLRQRGQKKRA